MDGACNTHEETEIIIRFWWGDLKERDILKDLGVDGWKTLKFILNECRMS
jgi:hypothetical protein